ncbi:ABC transporter ATP-binding protein [Burkholderiaceae bacterium FT117]|uniref:dipeptide ABC transporter ATP-binding protein n=1 Tax=Zeimonas sediminis TaxID=2944268 RepID=UPI00234306A5|nr:ABC transporter ATP-binding protein [Zeimonas sediminis]MCM5569790.1 ABC transporter ATP-binding protein [Zeimonas sediminis]
MSTQVPLLRVDDLAVDFRTRRGTVHAVRGVSFELHKGRTLGIVGESGSGKSVTSYAVMKILDRAARIAGGAIEFGGISIAGASEAVMGDLRGREISMVFQNPRAALNPIRPIGRQIEDVLIRHAQATRATARARAIETLEKVRIRDAAARYHAYPFELSGGMCQRVVIALALACRPQLLIADEPTTGLDVTTQKAVMELIRDLIRSEGMAMVLITHDLGLAGEYCDDIVVMERGLVVEAKPARALFTEPEHPYTRRLIRATPHGAASVADLLPVDDEPRAAVEHPQAAAPTRSSAAAAEARPAVPLLEVVDLSRHYPAPATLRTMLKKRSERPVYKAVDGISFSIMPGESVGLVGESGCGKSTTSSMLMRLLEPSGGSIRFQGKDISLIRAADFARSPLRRELQMVFQDPTESLNPRSTAFDAIADPLRSLLAMRDEAAVRARVGELAAQVGLPGELLDRLPHQLSGGQKARVGIARAVATQPSLLVLDEPTAALDVSVQAVVLNLLADLRRRYRMSYLFVSHDLEVVRLLCDRVIVMRAGRIVEQGPAAEVLSNPADPYTRALLEAIPRPPFLRRAAPEPLALRAAS